jgi:hypothetical protein
VGRSLRCSLPAFNGARVEWVSELDRLVDFAVPVGIDTWAEIMVVNGLTDVELVDLHAGEFVSFHRHVRFPSRPNPDLCHPDELCVAQVISAGPVVTGIILPVQA